MSRSPRSASAVALALLIVLGSCAPNGGQASPTPQASSVATDLVPVLASSEIVKGPNRILFTLIDRQNQIIAAPDVAVRMDLAPADPAPAGCTPVTATATYMPSADDRGLYRANADLGCGGEWSGQFVATGPAIGERTANVRFDVREQSSTPLIGAQVPSVTTPTADTPAGIADISTDDDPDPDFYRTSEDDALTTGRPFVVVFATPAFCQTAACGPTLDLVKTVAAGFKDRVTFIHVEPYILEKRDGALQPVLSDQGELQAVEQSIAFGLISEPYIFVVGADGRVAAKFEAIASEEELTEAFRSVSDG